MDWDDLRYFVELVRAGTLSGAAHRLGVTHTTISRRLQRLEQRIGEPVFTRSSQGYALTARGQTLWTEAQRVEAAFMRIGEQLPESPATLSGMVRIGCTEAFGSKVIAPLMAALGDRYPALHIDLIVQPRPILLAKNEADIVITIDRPERGPYTIMRLTDYSLHFYASPGYLAKAGPVTRLEDLESHRMISYVEEHSPARDVPMVPQFGVHGAVALRSTSIAAQAEMVKAGAGIAVLPDFLVSEHDGLVQVLHETSFFRSFWIIVPIALRKLGRIRAVSEAIVALMREQRPVLIRK